MYATPELTRIGAALDVVLGTFVPHALPDSGPNADQGPYTTMPPADFESL